MYYWLFIASAIIIMTPVLYFKKNTNWCIVMLYIAGIFAFCPMFLHIYHWGGIPVSLVFPAQLFTGGVEYKNFIEIINSLIPYAEPKRTIVMVCCTLIYVLAPVFTIGFVFNYVRKSFDSLFIRTLIKKDIYIFSEFNDNTLVFANSLKRNNNKAVIIFAKSEKLLEYKGFLFAEFSVERIFEIINITNSVHIIFADKDEDSSLNRFFSFKDKAYNKKVEVYVYSTKREAEYIIDEVKNENSNMDIQLINTEQLLIFDTLWNYPLYSKISDDKKFNITVFGIGNMGASFVKDVLWCTSLAGFETTINLIDREDAEKNLTAKCPHIDISKHNINVYREDMCGKKLSEFVKDINIGKTNYIFVSLGDDSLNVDVSSKLRLYFARENKYPAIVTVIENDVKREILSKVFSEEEIMLTGNISQFCDYEYMFKNNFFRFGVEVYKEVAKHYEPEKEITHSDFLGQIQSEIYSSLSNAVHIKYKIFSMMGTEFDYERTKINRYLSLKAKNEKNEKLLEGLKKEIESERKALERKINDNISILSESEHIRWEMFERLKGYQGVEEDKLESYIAENRRKIDCGYKCKLHKDIELKINACITSYSGLDKLDELIRKFGKDPYCESVKIIDQIITLDIPAIWYGEIE